MALLMMDVGFSLRAATLEDQPEIRSRVAITLNHPEGGARPPSLRGSIERGEVLLLEFFDPRERQTRIGGFIEYRLRVDDSLTIREIGVEEGPSQVAVAKHLLNGLLDSVRPTAATIKVLRDAAFWNEIIETITGFQIEGPSEYSRRHYFNVWEWRRERAASRGSRPRGRRQ
ncbi:MAG: hypothetical protein ACKVVP_25060 [Chloroflexota bacterium]